MGTLAFSIPQFCAAHDISRASLYNLWRNGLGPCRMKVGSRTLISVEAAAEWRRQCESASQPHDKQAA
jgi:hypothetical protein